MFFIKKTNKAFTLIELIIVITLLGLFATGLSNINLTKSTDKQRAKIFANKIITTVESIRNNSLMGKSITNGHSMYQVEINFTLLTGSGKVNISYNTGSLLPFTNSPLTIIPQKNYSINQIECLLIDGTADTTPTTNSGTISIIGNDFSLIGCGGDTKILKITAKYRGIEEYISINIVNGLVTTD